MMKMETTFQTVQRHSPTLDTIQMVEHTLQTMTEDFITIAELKRKLPRQVNHYTLMTILRYLEQSNKLLITLDGITWLREPGPGLRALLAESVEYEELKNRVLSRSRKGVRRTSSIKNKAATHASRGCRA